MADTAKAQNTQAQNSVTDPKQGQPEAAKPAAAPAKPATKKYRLKDPKTQYAEGSFTLAGAQEKELPNNPSPELRKRIKAGFIVEVK